VGDGLADEGVGVRHSAAILGCVLRLSQTNRSDFATNLALGPGERANRLVDFGTGEFTDYATNQGLMSPTN
jgi:hypothetical protein